MTQLDIVRVVLYVLGATFGMGVAIQVIGLRVKLARIFAFVMLTMSLNCLTLLFGLLLKIFEEGRPLWLEIAFTVDAILLAVGPMLLALFLGRMSHDDRA